MNIKLRSNYTSQPEAVMTIEPEEIARQVIGQRMTFLSRHDVTFQFANGSATMDDIELIIYIMPNQFFCYRGDDVIATIVLFIIFLIPTFFGVYEWQYALAFTIGGVLADIVGRKIKRLLVNSKNDYEE